MNDKRLNSAEFEQFYEDILTQKVQEIEALKQELKKGLQSLAVVIAVLGTAASLYCAYYKLWVGVFLSPLAGLILYVVLRFTIAKEGKQSEAAKIYKRKIFLPAFRYFYPDTRYFWQKGFSLTTIQKSLLFFPKPTEQKSEDFIVVSIGNTVVQFHETRLIQGAGKDSEVVFDGLFCVVSFNKKFRGQTLIHSKKSVGLRQELHMKFQSVVNRGMKVELESSEFMENFYVMSDRQIEARYILSPSMMQRMLDYQRKFALGLSFSFFRNQMFVKIPVTEDLFDLDLLSYENRKATIKRHLSYFLAITDIVEDLNLNNQIWNK